MNRFKFIFETIKIGVLGEENIDFCIDQKLIDYWKERIKDSINCICAYNCDTIVLPNQDYKTYKNNIDNEISLFLDSMNKNKKCPIYFWLDSIDSILYKDRRLYGDYINDLDNDIKNEIIIDNIKDGVDTAYISIISIDMILKSRPIINLLRPLEYPD